MIAVVVCAVGDDVGCCGRLVGRRLDHVRAELEAVRRNIGCERSANIQQRRGDGGGDRRDGAQLYPILSIAFHDSFPRLGWSCYCLRQVVPFDHWMTRLSGEAITPSMFQIGPAASVMLLVNLPFPVSPTSASTMPKAFSLNVSAMPWSAS